MFVFWILVIVVVVAIGFIFSYCFGDRLYDKTQNAIKAYTEEEVITEVVNTHVVENVIEVLV